MKSKCTVSGCENFVYDHHQYGPYDWGDYTCDECIAKEKQRLKELARKPPEKGSFFWQPEDPYENLKDE